MMPIFDTKTYETSATREATAAKALADDRPDITQVHASLAIADAQLTDMAARTARTQGTPSGCVGRT
jgi:hypothetical protein